ncbi:BTB/POZ domain-containing protein 17 [Eurytemora carolleeae]|uniref:BTB/POZ domain-containing protein 17 n=1 Tax=Eurytemora carolleeae TaxID=1294199 RepID=UPI000C772370|nr:BTB/POZ domain-containing protein 17 [Eurytemora carolleeae]|eukprot:XP_023344194.1 BTB/POZ domain-containing protein 17-like [Eurytemora affinis]
MDNSSQVITKIAGIYAERLMSDVLLVVGDQELPAHRLILCASSEVFQVMLMNSKWSESQEKKIILMESPACAAVFEVFLKYLYTGKIHVNYANVIPLLQLADKYNVKDLLKLGLSFMSRNVSLAGKRNQVVSWYQFTTNCGYSHVSSLCLDFLKWNYELVSNSIDWPNIEGESLVRLLSCSDIVVHDEIIIFNSVQSWLEEQGKRMEKDGDSNFISLDHPPPLAICFHLNGRGDDLKENISLRNCKICLIFRSREGAIKNILKLSGGDRLLTPRLYTEDKYCASLSVDYFPQLPMYHCRSLHFSAFESTAFYAGENQVIWGDTILNHLKTRLNPKS